MPSQLFYVVPDERFIILQLQVPNLDSDACDEMQATLAAQLEERKLPVVLDLSRAKFLPSLALGMLVNVKRQLDERNNTLSIVGLSLNIRRALSLSALDRIFNLAETIEQIAPRHAVAH